GTIFLDEVGTMDLSTQISLLRVLETYRFTRVGANKERDADVRIIAATNRDLLDLVESNQFREDLYYRLNVFTIAIPPLRERAEDVVPIAERFLRFFAKRYGTPARCLSDKALERLLGHEWPGNVRELRNVMEQTAVFAQREVVHADEIQFISTRLPTHQKGRGERTASSPQITVPSATHHDMPAPAPEPPADFAASSPTPPPIEVTPTPLSPVSSGPVSSPPASYTPTPASAAVESVSARPSSPGGDEHPLVL